MSTLKTNRIENLTTTDGGISINNSGQIGIGETTPTRQLHVVDDANNDVATFINSDSTNGYGVNIRAGGTASGRYALRVANDSNNVVLQANANGNVLVGTTDAGYPGYADHFTIGDASDHVGLTLRCPNNKTGQIYFSDTTGTNNAQFDGYIQYDHNVQSLIFGSAQSERMRINSSGNLGVGTASPSQILELKTAEPRLCLNATNASSSLGIEFEADGQRQGHIFHNHTSGEFSISCGENTSGSHFMTFKTGDGTTRMRIENDGDVGIGITPSSKLHVIGNEIRFSNSTNASYYGTITHDAGTTGANIYNSVDSTVVSHIWQNSGNEKMRLTSAGYVKCADSGSYYNSGASYHEFNQSIAAQNTVFNSTNSNFGATHVGLHVSRVATTAYWFLQGVSGSGSGSDDTEFYIRGDGNAYIDGSWNGGGADYAEYFEWSDGNTEAEDRRGISVVLDGDKIRKAVEGEEPIGVISGNPSVVGDADVDRWKGKYLRDDYGSYILNEEGYRQLNPDYDSSVEYVQRENRPEWDCVGLMGKLRIRKGQVTGSRWIKMRDISDSVEEWLVR